MGSELLRGKLNTHVSVLARRLTSIGLELSEERTIGDDLGALTAAIRHSLKNHAIVIVTGGLGPTFDDLTREAAAAACGRPLVFSKRLLQGIQAKFKRFRLHRMPPANARQAYLLEGAIPIPNQVGTAPGQWIQLPGRGTAYRAPTNVLILLPGPPSELIPMLDDSVLPRLRKAFPAPPTAEAHLHFVGVPESVVDHKIRPVIAREKGIQFTILAHLGLVDLDIFVSESPRRSVGARHAVPLRDRIVKNIRAVMGRAFYGMNDSYPLEKVIADAFLRNKATLAVAESCTGGMLAKGLTDIPGSSGYFLGGVVCYSNDVKAGILGVSRATLQKYGAVSKPVAAALAKGARAAMGSTWGLGITGIAGPTGAAPAKPIGLVYVSLAGKSGGKTLEYRFPGSRDAIRQRAVIAALDLLRRIYGRNKRL